jgi:ATP-dependent DNA helicase RecG
MTPSASAPSSGRPTNETRAPRTSVRPAPASILEKPVQYLRGVGPHRAELLAQMGITMLADLLEYFPFRHEDQGRPQPIDTLQLDTPATVIGAVESVNVRGLFRNQTVNVKLRDGTGVLLVTWFNATYLKDKLERGQILRVYGTVGVNHDLAQMTNPRVQWLDPDEDPATWDHPRLVPVYSATEKINSQQIARLVETALAEGLPEVKETVPVPLLEKHGFIGRVEAIRAMHQPRNLEEIAPARERLAYEELFLMQLAISLQRKWAAAHARAPQLPVTPKIDEHIRRRFPFTLTPAQDKVIREIAADLATDRPMTRLLQGDVGSGKTVVALYAALVAVANRHQCAILAPTEVLAAQHFAGLDKYLVGSRVRRCLLTGKTTAAQRKDMLAAIEAGNMDLIVGTQALLEDRVKFGRLGVVVVDEQHKFGVSQRATLRDSEKTTRGRPPRRADSGECPDGQARRAGSSRSCVAPVPIPHYLVMTATPIPRTLSMTVFGDLDVSVIKQLPPGRQPIVTKLVRPRDQHAAWTEVRRRIAAGEQAYVVYPLVEESETIDLKAATLEVHHVANDLLPGARVGLMHGRMKNAEKQAVMRDFAQHRLDVLVSTTVIEVGVDVPNATVMVIEHAERYGLSALHQLRGRVGRGTKPSICLLFSEGGSETARRRLDVLCQTTDGFRIAEEDLKIRGPGELLGTRQHGWPEFRLANLIEDADLLMQARDDAAEIVREDPLLVQKYGPLRAELRRKFRDKVAFIDVG